MSTNVHITGDGNVIGRDNRVVTTINTKLMQDPERAAVAEALALLRVEIDVLDIAERYKRRSGRAIQDVEDELVEDSPDAHGLHSAVQRISETMKDAGESYDVASGWARRLSDAVGAMARMVPQAAGWLPF